jgi:hypothetical protein
MIVLVVCFHCGQHIIIEASESVDATQSPALFFEKMPLVLGPVVLHSVRFLM